MVSIILIFFSAICNAVMDVCSFHYQNSIFSRFNPQWWNPEISWRNKYVDGDPKKGFKKWFFGLLDYPTFLTDAWHFFKSSMIVLFCAAIVLYKPVVCPLIDFAIIGIVWNLAFNLCYNKFFVKK
jgi:hypothetical protein